MEDHDPEFDVEDNQQPPQVDAAGSAAENPATAEAEGGGPPAEESASQPKAKKKKKRKTKQAAEDDQQVESATPAQQASTEALPSIMNVQKPDKIIEVMDSGRDKEFKTGNVDVGEENKEEKEDLEISDGEAPDVEEAKRNLRSQAEKKRKAKKTVVQGVNQDVIIDTPATEEQVKHNLAKAFSLNQPQNDPTPQGETAQAPDVNRPGLAGDDAPESEMEDSAMMDASNSMQQVENQASAAQVPLEESKVNAVEEVKLPPIAGAPGPPAGMSSEDYAAQLQAQYDEEANNDEDEEAEVVEEAVEDDNQGRRRSRSKKGRRRQRTQDQNQNDFDFRDNVDIELMQQDFSREHFRKLIKKTFDDYYPLEYNKSNFDMDEYLQVVMKEQLEAKFSVHLEMSDENILTIRNMPWLDLGELPISYNTHKSEAFQVYLIPQDELPFNIVVPYNNWHRAFDMSRVRHVYPKTQLATKGISQEDIQDTLRRGSELMKDYRGKLAKRNKIVQLCLAAAFLVIVVIAVIIGMLDQGNYWAPLLIVVFYLICFLIVTTIFKYRSSYHMRISQFLLSVFCRAENNRLYLKHGVEVRPGFLGKWIEFTCLDNGGTDEIIQQMRQRFLKPTLEQRAAIFDKQIMGQTNLIAEQQDIEQQIRMDMQNQHADRDAQERAEVQEAVLESNPNDFSEEHDLSLHALGAAGSSQAAMAQYEGQAPGMPPSTVNKKPKKGRKKKKDGQMGALMIDGPAQN